MGAFCQLICSRVFVGTNRKRDQIKQLRSHHDVAILKQMVCFTFLLEMKRKYRSKQLFPRLDDNESRLLVVGMKHWELRIMFDMLLTEKNTWNCIKANFATIMNRDVFFLKTVEVFARLNNFRHKNTIETMTGSVTEESSTAMDMQLFYLWLNFFW